MRKTYQRTKPATKGASLTEYGMLAGLIALLGIGTVYGLGGTVQNVYCIATEAVSGVEGSCLDVAENPDNGDGGDGGGQGGDGDTPPPPPPPPPTTGMVLRVTGTQASFRIHDSTPGDVVVDWGDGTTSLYAGVANFVFTKSYPASGTYTITITGTAQRFTSLSPNTLIAVDSFGDLGWTSLEDAFVDHDDLDQLAALPPTVTSLNGTFTNADGVLAGVGAWNVANVMDFTQTFRNASAFNQPIAGWNTAAATTMSEMFHDATSFNQPIGGWDVSNVSNMVRMFQDATSFTGNLSEWDVSGVTARTSLDYTFSGAINFTSDLSGWCVPTITSRPTGFGTYTGITAYPVWGYCGQPQPGEGAMVMTVQGTSASFRIYDTAPSDVVIDWGDGTATPYTSTTGNQTLARTYVTNGTYTVRISGTFSRFSSSSTNTLVSVDNFGQTGVTSIRDAFEGHTRLVSVAPLPETVTDLSEAFRSITTNPTGLDAWYTGNVQLFTGLFQDSTLFNQDIGSWDTSGATNLDNLFYGATSFNQNLPWDTSAATSMVSAFRGATAFNGNISGWDVTSLTDATRLAYFLASAPAFRGDLSNWCVAQIDARPQSFAMSNQLPAEPVWGYCGTPAYDPNGMQLTVSGTNASLQFYDSTPGDVVVHWGDGYVTPYTSAGTTETLGRTYAANGVYTVRVTGTFQRLLSRSDTTLVSVDSFGNHGINSLNNAFQDHTQLASLAPIPAGVTDMRGVFQRTTSPLVGVENWNVSAVTRMDSAFQDATGFNRPIGGWNVSSVTNMSTLFNRATSFNQSLDWDVDQVTDVRDMFRDATAFNGDITQWNLPLVTSSNMTRMFNGATSFNRNLSGWCVTATTGRPTGFATASQFTEPTWNSCPP